jgi:hypothetical protein
VIYGSKRPFRESLAGQKLGDVSGRRFICVSLADCEISKACGAEFLHCSLRGAKFTSEDVRDYIGMTATLDCQTFEGVELPPVAFDLFLKLFSLTLGNDEKRKGLRALIDPTRLRIFDRIFPDLE